ncbi:MAG: hypothetical protein Q4D17_02110 [Planctomycetia bacterium]|nr:hypothetical protein [Planctomycetia bacterium]
MATWSNTNVATLTVRKAGTTTDNFNFVGVNSDNNAGSPEDFLAATNRILAIAGMSATITGMKREITQEVIQDG